MYASHIRSWIIVVAAWLWTIQIHAYHRDTLHYAIVTGLPSNTIYRISQSKEGFIWLATDAGLVRYDGRHFRTFTMNDGLPDNEIISVTCDKAGSVFISPFQEGLCYLDSGIIYNKSSNTRLQDLDHNPTENPPYVKAFPSRSGGVIALSGNRLIVYRSNTATLIDSTPKKFFYERDDSTLVVISPHGCTYYKNGHFSRYNVTGQIRKMVLSALGDQILPNLCGDLYLIDDSVVCRLHELEPGKFEIKGARNYPGIFFLNVLNVEHNLVLVSDHLGRTYTIDTGMRCVPYKPLPDIAVSTAYIDRDSNVWLGTLDHGLFLLRKSSDIDTVRLSMSPTTCTYSDALGRLWLGNSEGDIRCYRDKSCIFFARIGNGHVRRILYDSADRKVYTITDGTLCIWHEKTISRFVKENSFEGMVPKDIARSAQGMILAAGGGIYRYQSGHMEGPLLQGRYTTICATTEGFYLGTSEGVKYTNDLRHLSDLSASAPFLRCHILRICSSGDGIAWIARSDSKIAGLKNFRVVAMIDAAKDHWIRNSRIHNISTPAPGNLWISTDDGLHCYTYSNGQSIDVRHDRHLTTASGLSDDFVYDACLSGDRAWIGSYCGVTGVKRVPNGTKPLSLSVIATGLRVGDSVLPVREHYDLEYGHNRLAISFSGIAFGFNNKLLYRYMLEGNEREWEVTESPEIYFQSLPPAEYHLTIMAYCPDISAESAPLTISFTVQKPFFLKTWFILVMVLLFAGILTLSTLGWSMYRNRKSRQALELRRTMYDLEHKALRAQMNPHFIFNSLNSIQSYISSNDKENSTRYLTRFAKLVRQTLEISGHSEISVREEISYLDNYISLEKMRFKKFNYRIEADPASLSIPILPMMIQPFVENAINHGLVTREEGLLTITFSAQDDTLKVIIDDNGIGRAAAASQRSLRHRSLGMEVTRSRIEAHNAMHQNKIRFDILDKRNDNGTPAGTKVILYFPY